MLEGKVALVTGASRGIGAACAKRLAKSGAAVVVNFYQRADLAQEVVASITSKGGQALAFQADVTEKAQVDAMVGKAIGQWGKIDILINNAAHVFTRKPFLETAWEDYQYQINGSLKGVVNCCQAVLPGMMERKAGSIVNILTVQIWRPGFGFQPYAAGKGAVQALSRALAREFAAYGIRVNTVSPSFTLSESRMNNPLEQRKASAAKTPLGRNALPQDVAEAVLFLASGSSDFITGANIHINGGQVLD